MTSRFASVARTPITWRYGAIASGVVLTQGLGYLWYSPNALGSFWDKNLRVNVDVHSREENQKYFLLNTVADTGLAVLLQYLSDRYFRPITVLDAFVMSVVVGLVRLLPEVSHVLRGRRKVSSFVLDHVHNVLGIFIKVLCLQNIPY